MEKSITMKDIAQELNVSVVSVSKALSGKDGVSDRIRKKILAKADELGYKYAGKSGKTALLKAAVLIPEQYFGENTFYGEFYRKLLKYSQQIGFSVSLEIITEANERSCELPDAIKEFGVDGIVFLGEINKNYIKNVENCNVPLVLLDFYDNEGKYDAVISSGFMGTYLLTKMLINEGMNDLAFIGNINATSSIMDRYLGFYKALNEFGIELQKGRVISDRADSGVRTEIALPEKLPQAFVCNCDQTAYILINQLLKNGIGVPRDVSVVGFDDSKFASICSTQLTTYHVNIDNMCSTALSMLKNKITDKKTFSHTVTVYGKTVLRSSHFRMKK